MTVYVLRRFSQGMNEVLGVFATEADAREAGVDFEDGYWRTQVRPYRVGAVPETFVTPPGADSTSPPAV